MKRKTQNIIWHLLRDVPSNDIVIALAGGNENNNHRKFCELRGFTFEDATKAICELFDEVKPEE
jgi:hypothetical protein